MRRDVAEIATRALPLANPLGLSHSNGLMIASTWQVTYLNMQTSTDEEKGFFEKLAATGWTTLIVIASFLAVRSRRFSRRFILGHRTRVTSAIYVASRRCRCSSWGRST